MTAGDLMADIARIQKDPHRKAEIAARWRGKVWSNDELTAWARWIWQEGTRV